MCQLYLHDDWDLAQVIFFNLFIFVLDDDHVTPLYKYCALVVIMHAFHHPQRVHVTCCLICISRMMISLDQGSLYMYIHNCCIQMYIIASCLGSIGSCVIWFIIRGLNSLSPRNSSFDDAWNQHYVSSVLLLYYRWLDNEVNFWVTWHGCPCEYCHLDSCPPDSLIIPHLELLTKLSGISSPVHGLATSEAECII